MLEGRFEGEEAVAQSGSFGKLEVAELVEPLQDDVAREAGYNVEIAAACAQEPDRTDSIETGEGQAARDLHRKIVLAERGGGEGHGG